MVVVDGEKVHDVVPAYVKVYRRVKEVEEVGDARREAYPVEILKPEQKSKDSFCHRCSFQICRKIFSFFPVLSDYVFLYCRSLAVSFVLDFQVTYLTSRQSVWHSMTLPAPLP